MANDFTRLAKKLEDLPRKMRKGLDDAVETEMEATANTARSILALNRSIATGNLESSIRPRRVPHKGTGFATHAASAMTRYAKFVENGTGFRGRSQYKAPTNVPVNEIFAWIVEKGIQPYAYDSQYELAVAIANVIENYGTRAHPFMGPAWKRHKPEIVRESSAAISTAVRRL
jgi:HK97 gp10 family phage protein